MTRFETVDVFTTRRFGGNPLAVIPDATTLDPADFQAIAREFNYSETSFVLPPQDPTNHAQVRIFTPAEEMPFAGHPNVGTAYVLGQVASLFGEPVPDSLRFEEIAGVVHVKLMRDGPAVKGAEVRAPRALARGAERPAEAVAALCGLAARDVIGTTHAPVYASVGAGFLFAEVNAAALASARPDFAAFRHEAERLATEAQGDALPAIFLWSRADTIADALAVHARMFAPLSGIIEDPATGSAAAALGALLASIGLAARLRIRQGYEMGRESHIDVRTDTTGTWIGGRCVPVFSGHIRG